MNIDQLHDKILYPVTRVRSNRAGGSGVLVASLPDLKNPGKHHNICLTCEHVIADSIKVKNEWDPVLKRDRKQEFFEEVGVEIFDYDGSKVVSSNSTQADIIAYDKHHDIAVLKLHNFRKMPHVATIIPEKEIDSLRIYDPAYACGCSLLHDPFPSVGILTYLREIIDQKSYIMSSTSAVFGNSGGGLFHGNTMYLLGLVSRMASVQVGFGVDLMTWMNFATHPARLYEFLKEQELQFIYDPADNYYDAMDRRKKRQKEALRGLLTEDTPTSVHQVHPIPDEYDG